MSDKQQTPIEVARAFVAQQSGGEWGDELEEKDAQALALVIAADRSRMERDHTLLLKGMREIAKPALGGKAQQFLAQAILHELGEK
jgi:hypothetical protein